MAETAPVDQPPKDGVFRDARFRDLTPEEAAEGETLGAGSEDVDFIVDEDGNRIPLDAP